MSQKSKVKTVSGWTWYYPRTIEVSLQKKTISGLQPRQLSGSVEVRPRSVMLG